jgi:hypothetical protein
VLETIKREWQAKFTVVIFLFFTLSWLLLHLDNSSAKNTLFGHSYLTFFGITYGLMALWGGICGIRVARGWGFAKSIMGKAIILFSLGLFAQEFGQISLSIIDYVFNIQGAYPSIGDIGFFSTIPFYIIGTFFLAKASGVKIGLRSFINKIQAVVIPLVVLIFGYLLFLQGYVFDWHAPLKVFLDFAYPLGDAVYVSLAVLTYLLSRKVLGGAMKNKIFFILFALVFQFITDYTFLYQSSRGTWSVGGVNDYMYFISYFLMTIGLLQLKTILDKIKSGVPK